MLGQATVDLEHPPREFAECSYNVRRRTEMARGGHFAERWFESKIGESGQF